LSNFLLWKSAYAEIVFLKKPWPDFRKKDLKKILDDYQNIRINKGK
jgi:undecaprenyl diphosphate synthase